VGGTGLFLTVTRGSSRHPRSANFAAHSMEEYSSENTDIKNTQQENAFFKEKEM
jgi:hypothetical protein